ncbi:MAG: type III pantothenate kinase [Clostridium sp.]|uniref:type III pantothenate kinase n=1 Tax=Clostridium sp. TaxID=1506 RepID=UPI002908FCC6|nr:type III pantothenate kinase [Clostridium sp.]MDU7337312.1 type III pantothenate kinase [Clostridium sp.]
MLLTVDIGNSHITLGGFEQETLVFVANLLTSPYRTEDQYAVELLQIMNLHHAEPKEINGIIISSVVPEVSAPIQRAFQHICEFPPLVLGPGVKTGLNILIENPAQLGSDMVANAVAAVSKHPLPCVIFDMGTAITVSFLDKKGNFLGGMICAGVNIMLHALTTQTALLPHISLENPDHFIGKNTVQSMQSGMLFGTAAMLDGLASRFATELHEPPTLIATGGMAQLVTQNCVHPFIVDKHLMLEGLRLIYEKNRKTTKPPRSKQG